MIFTMFSAITVNAADAKGIDLSADISKDNKTITVNATASGTEGALSNFTIAMTVPEGVTTDNVKAESASTQSLTTNVADGILYVGFLDMSGKGVTFADNKLVTITISLPTALTDDVTMTLTEMVKSFHQALWRSLRSFLRAERVFSTMTLKVQSRLPEYSTLGWKLCLRKLRQTVRSTAGLWQRLTWCEQLLTAIL